MWGVVGVVYKRDRDRQSKALSVRSWRRGLQAAGSPCSGCVMIRRENGEPGNGDTGGRITGGWARPRFQPVTMGVPVAT